MRTWRPSPQVSTRQWALALLAALAYLPALLSSPGRMPADTKLYLYLDPSRLTKLAASSWDTSQFGGWVPHQMTTYLWPAGPWYWVWDLAGAPDWVAHRLFVATILFVAGWGILRLAECLELPLRGAIVAAVVYQCSVYILPYISRTSLMLLPWAALGWLTVLTIRTIRTGEWRHAAAFGLVIFSVAHVNPTAFLMIVPGPVLWVILEWRARRVSTKQVLRGSARLVGVSVAVSVWWVIMLLIQARHGADVLAYSETLESVSFTASAPEISRGLGYWLFYISDPFAPATSASVPYQEHLLLIAIGFLLTIVCAAGLVVGRWQQRSYAAGLVVVGVVLSVGVHPFNDPSPMMRAIRDTDLGLALRSSTRALPLMMLGLGLGGGVLASRVRLGHPRLTQAMPWLVGLLALANIPSLWTAQLVDDGLDRDQDLPPAWNDAADALRTDEYGSRVLQLPGAEFGAYRWGYTVDPPLPFVSEKPAITRDLLPLGSPGVMDLLYSFDNRIQSGALDTDSVAPVARLLGADQIWLSNDQAFERFRTPRPELLSAELTYGIDGLGTVTAFGEPQPNLPEIRMIDEQALSEPAIGQSLSPVELIDVDQPVAPTRVVDDIVILDGSGAGIVDAAGAGLLTGHEAILLAADLRAAGLATDQAGPPGQVRLIVTDSNRDRSEQWRGSQDSVGMTESGGVGHDTTGDDDDTHQALPRAGAGDPLAETIALLSDGVTVQASRYGDPFALFPEYRAAMAVDGDLETGWAISTGTSPIGESIRLTGTPSGDLSLIQLQGPEHRLWITGVEVHAGDDLFTVDLTEESLSAPGQVVELPSDVPLSISIASTELRPGAPDTGDYWVGFAELGPTAQEYVRPPTLLLDQVTAADDLSLVFTRERVRPTDRWRSDPEPALARRFELPVDLIGDLTVTLRRDDRASDAALAALGGVSSGPTSSARLTGVPAAVAMAAFDREPDTAWTSPFHTAVGASVTVPLEMGTSIEQLTLQQPTDTNYSTITAVAVELGGERRDLVVPAPADDGSSVIEFSSMSGDLMRLEITAVDPVVTADRRYGDPTTAPVALIELFGVDPVITYEPAVTCRTDLLWIDDAPIGLSVDGQALAALAAGDSVEAIPCTARPIDLSAGEHRMVGSSGSTTAISVDQVIWRTVGTPAPTESPTSLEMVGVGSSGQTNASVTVPPCPSGCWFVFGQGFNDGWTASADSADLGAPIPISGGFNGWWLAPSDEARQIEVRFAPQRLLQIGLLLSLLAVLACAIVAMRGWRHRNADDPTPLPPGANPSDHNEGVTGRTFALLQRDSARRSLVAAVALTVAAASLVSPVWGLAGLIAATAIVTSGRIRLIGGLGLVVIGLVALVVVGRQFSNDYVAGPGWPRLFDDMHRIALFAMLLFGVTMFSDDRTEPSKATPVQPPEDDDD